MGQIGFLSLRERHECRFFVLFRSNSNSKGTKKMKKKVKKLSLAVILTLLITMLVLLAACGAEAPATTATPGNDLATAQDIGEGSKRFSFQMFDGEGNVLSWNVHTDETTVGAALVEVGLIEGEVSDFGLMVSHVNGIRADFVEDDAYWAFYIDDDFAMVGVDATDIEEGVTYKFIYTEA